MALFDARVIAAAVRVLARGETGRYYTAGASEVELFERELAKFIGTRYALGVNSGTSALICALVGLGIGPGDEVLVPAYTWVATAAAPLAVGAVPVLTEVDWSLTMDPADIRRKITPNTKAIIVVHMINLVANMDEIMKIAREHNLLVIEDTAQAVGCSLRGRRVGSMGDVGAFSFQLNKNIQCGEGGAVLTNSERAHVRATMYHDVGSYVRKNKMKTDEPLFIGQNYRMPNLSGALLRPQLKRLDKLLEVRRSRRRWWLERLHQKVKGSFVVSPHHDPEAACALTLRFDKVEDAQAFGQQRGVARLIDATQHVYTHWESILSGVRPHPKMDPYAWAERDVRITAESCPRTLEILSHTCEIRLFPELPTSVYRAMVSTSR
jgi:dTDP-4-amino-4,6-dideoxygalactose transaminase